MKVFLVCAYLVQLQDILLLMENLLLEKSANKEVLNVWTVEGVQNLGPQESYHIRFRG